jgi:adenylate kinase
MENGDLVPDSLITEICLHRLSQHDCITRGWVLDGFPRTEGQAQSLIDSGLKINRFVFLSADKERLIERACGRRLDPDTGKIYHLKFNPPPDKIIHRLIQRSDDREEIVQARLQGYFQTIEGVIQQFSNVHVVEADSNGGIFDVFHQIVRGIAEVRETDNQAIRNCSALGRERLISRL